MSIKERLKKHRKKIVLFGVLILLILLVVIRLKGVKSPLESTEQQTYIPINAQTVEKQSIAAEITVSGKIQAEKEALIFPKSMGQVQSVAVKVGDYVTEGQILYSLDKSDLQATYDQAQAGYKLAKAGYEMKKKEYELAKANYEKLKELHELGGISDQELEQAEMLASENVLKSAQAQFAQAEAQYRAAVKAYQDLDIKSPIAGVVTALNLKVGDMATNAAPVATVVDLNNVFVSVSVSEKVINQIQKGQKVLVEVDSVNQTIEAKIDSLSPAADQRTGKYELKIKINNSEKVLKPGMFAKVFIATATKQDTLVVPAEAVVFQNGKNVVFVVENNKAREREVTLGLENGRQIEILEGLQAGDVIVIKGMNFVSDGAEIKIIELDGVPVDQGGGAKE
ncbi:MAG: efflux RND transporter periplasmic adaptor subunit [Desulfitobacteriia bacterium]|jgi:RND family efflux transporter MFP subunit